jgi:CO dehydrogenase maturation factor
VKSPEEVQGIRQRMKMIATEKTSIAPLSAPRETGWRVVIAGKGGAGKTTLTALLALCAAQEGDQVLAVDADPQETLAYFLGVPQERARSLVPLSKNTQYIEEKIHAKDGTVEEQALSLDLHVDDVIERFAIKVRERLHLLVMGGVENAASGCLCPEYALISGIVRYLALSEREVVLMDTQAGIEHFGRGLASGFQHALIVAEPTFSSLLIAEQSARLSLDLGIPHLHLAINKIRNEQEISRVKEFATGLSCYEHVFTLPYEEGVRQHDPDVSGLLASETPFMSEIWKIYRIMKNTQR